jgi:DNA-binding MurR/RpiR family transcriptional regulator
LRDNLSPASRLAGTLSEIGDDLEAAFGRTLDIHGNTLENLRRDVSPAQFAAAVRHLGDAGRVFAFGMGPSSSIASYLETQLDVSASRPTASPRAVCCSPTGCRS